MKKNIVVLSLLLSPVFIYQACQREDSLLDGMDLNYTYSAEPVLPATPYKYDMGSDLQAQLGRVLFYDRALSYSRETSCGTCHQQELAFTDGKRFSDGFVGGKTSRNTPPIFNFARQKMEYFWDMRQNDLSDMVLDPIRHSVEMGFGNIDQLITRLNGIAYYAPLFKSAFGTEDITEQRMGVALSAFIQNIRSVNSDFDQMPIDNFSLAAQKGLSLFHSSGCTNCHGGSNFNNLSTGSSPVFGGGIGGGGWGGNGGSGGSSGIASIADFANIGLDLKYADAGIRQDVLNTKPNNKGEVATGDGHFKVPSLRNIALTAPYMHDGRFSSLEEVLNHYSSGVQNHPSLDERLKEHRMDANGNLIATKVKRLNFSTEDKVNLIAFLNTLTDNNLITDKRYSNPFLVQNP
ncbi:MAG: hypothetical protein EP332_07610 [Bacteroidetes bacterium]|nr:MAG: hypothetical protein EP332_07610 [Bacteroidota bacterium]